MTRATTLPFSAGELAFFQQSPLASWIISSREGVVLAANIAATDFIPRTDTSEAVLLFRHYCRREDSERICERLLGRSLSESGSLGLFRLQTKEGPEQTVTLYASPFNVDGETGWQIAAVPAEEKTRSMPALVAGKALANEDFYRNLVFEASYGTMLCDAGGTISFVTSAVEAILGYKPEDVIGQDMFSYVHPADLETALHSFGLELNGTPEFKSIVIRLKNSSGGYTWCMVRGHNLLQHPGVEKFAIYFHDDSQRKDAADTLRASEERFRSLVRNLQVGVMLLNSEGAIQMVNDAMCRILRRSEPGVIGKFLWNLVAVVIDEEGNFLPREKRPVYQAIHERVAIHHRLNGYWVPEQNDYQWLLINADPIWDETGTMQYMLCSFTDITERKKLTQKLLDDKISQQRLLSQASLDGQERERREIGKELHDNIGQQLTTIKLYLDLLGAAPNQEERNRILGMALRCVSGTINEVRQISRLLVPHSLQDLGLKESVSELCTTIMRTGSLQISFLHSDFSEASLDERTKLALFRIVQEQLTNTIRHAKASEAIVRMRMRSGAVYLSIADNGTGFDPARVRKGLGLTNIQNRIELLGGKVKVVTAPGCGCCLKVMVPAGE